MDMRDLLSAAGSFCGSKRLHMHSRVLYEAGGSFEKNGDPLPCDSYQSSSSIELPSVAVVCLRHRQPTSKVNV